MKGEHRWQIVKTDEYNIEYDYGDAVQLGLPEDCSSEDYAVAWRKAKEECRWIARTYYAKDYSAIVKQEFNEALR